MEEKLVSHHASNISVGLLCLCGVDQGMAQTVRHEDQKRAATVYWDSTIDKRLDDYRLLAGITLSTHTERREGAEGVAALSAL